MGPKVIIPFGWLSKDGKLLLAAKNNKNICIWFSKCGSCNLSKVNWIRRPLHWLNTYCYPNQ